MGLIQAVVFAGYFGLGKLGLDLASLNASTTAVWPPSGFALAAVLLFGRGVWPAVFAGAFVVHAAATGQIGIALSIGLGDTLEALVGAALVDRLAHGTAVFDSPRTIFRFVAIALASAALGALIGMISLTVGGATPWPGAQYVWVTWWLAHVAGLVVVTPLVLLWSTSKLAWIGWARTTELLLLSVLFVLVTLVVFGGLVPDELRNYPLAFLCMPFLLWAAFRFGPVATATALAVLAGVAAWGTFRELGPFVRPSPNESLVLVQAYMSVIAVMGVVLAAAIREGRDAQTRLEELATTDPLTGLANYRRLLDVMRHEIARSSRTGRPFALLFVDMNGLKKINDKYGHLAGSRALCRLAQVLRRSCRAVDTPARFGGDEFAVVIPETAEAGARTLFTRVCDRLADDSAKPPISVSGGIAVHPRDGDSPTLLLRAADQALYADKTASKKAARAGSEERTGTLF